MPVEFLGDPSTYLGKGTVWLAPVDAPSRAGEGTWDGYWDLEPDGPPTPLERSPSFSSPGLAIDWGRLRTSRVLIRLDSSRGYWWAGTSSCPPELADDVEGMYPPAAID